MKTALTLLIVFLLGWWLLERYILLTREPFNRDDCDEYMRTEYGALFAFVKVEQRIDEFLLELENR